MGGDVGLHPAAEAHVVGVLGDLGKEITDPEAALPMLPELPRRGEQLGAGAEAATKGLAVVLEQLRLVIEGVDVGRASAHAEEDHPLRLRRKVRVALGERIGGRALGPGRMGEPREGEIAESATQRSEHVAARHGDWESVVAAVHGVSRTRCRRVAMNEALGIELADGSELGALEEGLAEG